MKNIKLLKQPANICIVLILLFLGMGFSSHAQTINGINYTKMTGDVANTFDMTDTDILGQRFPSEYLTLKDKVTGVKIIALTTSRHNDSKIYQTHPQWTPDGKYIIFRSDRAPEGERSLAYAISMDNYDIVQITTGHDGSNLHLGWHKNVAYHFRDNQLIELDLGRLLKDSENGTVNNDTESYEKVIAELPEGVNTSGGIGLDANEQRMFLASRIAENQSAIYSVDFKTGNVQKLIEVPFRANHLQANPWVSGEIMYCWETGGDAPQRIWSLSVDNKGNVKNRPLYKENPTEWVTHEVFSGPDEILFNVMGHIDRLRKEPTGLFSMNLRTGKVTRHGQTDRGGYWHNAGTKDGKWAVVDTFDGNIYRMNLETNKTTLLTTGHRPNSEGPFTNEAHAHQSISPDGKWVLFNSSMLTESDVMMVPLHPENLQGQSF